MNSNEHQPKLILFPGLGADERLFVAQRAAFPEAIVPPWIPPSKREGLVEYAARLAETLPREEPMMLCGVSLGGMVAYEVARHVRPKAVILIASCRERKGLRPLYRAGGKVWPIIPRHIFSIAKLLAKPTMRLYSRASREQQVMLVEMFREIDPAFMHWAVSAILGWNPLPLADVPVFHIHGRRDLMIPARLVNADTWIAHGGHLINLTHAGEVNEFVRTVIQEKPINRT